MSAPSSFTSAHAKGFCSGWRGRGLSTHDHVVTTPAVPTSTSSPTGSLVSGSYSDGGTRTRPAAVLAPRMRPSRRPARKRPSTGPTLRRYVYSRTYGALSTTRAVLMRHGIEHVSLRRARRTIALMPIPAGLRAVDLMLQIPSDDFKSKYEFLKPLLLDRESREQFEFPAQYMFKDIPTTRRSDDYVGIALDEMDRHGVERAMIGVGIGESDARRALKEHPDRFFGSLEVNPNLGMEGVRALVRAHEELGIKAATAFPAGLCPQVPINDKKFYPLYAKCVELGIPICICAGVPGPRVPMGVQDVALLDEVCWFFPDLKIVTRHGCEPWTDLAVKLMLKWPNLYYSTSAFAPRHYPKAIIDYANTRGADKIMYAGYFPMGLTLERIFRELQAVPFKDEVWPKFLRENAVRVFQL